MRVRWAISLEETMISSSFQNSFRRAILCSAESDVKHQRKFRFKEDALACLIGRLMSRAAAVLVTSQSWSELEFTRNENGKPSLVNQSVNFEYNVSHHGDLVVLVTGDSRIGVDVMQIEESRLETAEKKIDMLKRHFSENEILAVKGGEKSELQRWQAFFRIWCLKESILKATGVGLPDGLHNHTFQVDSDYEHVPGHTTTSTRYFHRQNYQPQWVFEESFIGEKHCIAVASEVKTPSAHTSTFLEGVIPFQITSLHEILKNADFINVSADVDEELDAFMEKPNKTF